MTRSVRDLVFQSIQDILNDSAYSNLKISEVTNQYNIATVDKALFTELVYGTVRRKMTLDFYLKLLVKTRIKGWVRQLLWMSLYQYVFLDKIPNHIIINKAVNITKHRGGQHNGSVINAILRHIFRSGLPTLETIKNKK